jgi:Cu-Zn family superoxide dismutase
MRQKLVSAAIGLAAALALASPASAADSATASLKDASGNEVGKATLTNTPSGVLIRLDLTAISPGEHAFHIHAVGKCEPPDFKSAGPHFNPDTTKHGFENPEGPHAGDMPNLFVPGDGKLSIELLNPATSMSGEAALLDADGAALVIHAGPDDYQTDPAGNAGDRIACGVITPYLGRGAQAGSIAEALRIAL